MWFWGKRPSPMPARAAVNKLAPPLSVVGAVETLGVRTPSGFLLKDRRIPPLTRPFSVWPYRSLSALVAQGTSSNFRKNQISKGRKGGRGVTNYLNEAHRPIVLLSETELSVTGTSGEQNAQSIFQRGRMGLIVGWQVSNV